MSVSGSVSDLMRDIPSVQVDVEGNVSLRGSGSVGRVVGAPSRMDADNLASVRPRQRVTTDYWMAYPTLHVSYAIDDRRELRLNYSLRVNRPEADALTSDAFMAFFQALLDAAA